MLATLHVEAQQRRTTSTSSSRNAADKSQKATVSEDDEEEDVTDEYSRPPRTSRGAGAADNDDVDNSAAPTTRRQTAAQKQASKQQTAQRPAANADKTVVRSGRVNYQPIFMQKQGDSLVINIDIDMTRLDLSSNKAQILTPVVGSDLEEIELPKVLIQGQARNKAFQRELELNDAAYDEFFNTNPPYAVVKPKGTLNYRVSLPYEEWMADAYLDVEEDLCGCGDQAKVAHTRVFDEIVVKKTIVAQPVYKVKQQVAYIKPEAEAVKKRKEIGNAYLEYPRGKFEIYPELGNNPQELAKIDKMIHDISTNKDLTVQGIYMTGYASPESSLKFNTELSNNRAKSLMKYFMNNSAIPASLFETHTGGEDWEGFVRLLEEYPIMYKNEILRIINTIQNLDEREHAISKVAGGLPYKTIYDELYPQLRRTVCEVNYTVKDFSLDEAKENLAIAPQLLSLNEMYLVANSYEVGSEQFLKVFEVAREEYPDDPIANLNGAAVALSKGTLREAEKYLSLSDTDTPEYANNMGVLLMLKGNYKEAERLLKQAETAGLSQATTNLKELRKKVANVKQRQEAEDNN
jgi:tetratricopeptide (TPR) repeat protein